MEEEIVRILGSINSKLSDISVIQERFESRLINLETISTSRLTVDDNREEAVGGNDETLFINSPLFNRKDSRNEKSKVDRMSLGGGVTTAIVTQNMVTFKGKLTWDDWQRTLTSGSTFKLVYMFKTDMQNWISSHAKGIVTPMEHIDSRIIKSLGSSNLKKQRDETYFQNLSAEKLFEELLTFAAPKDTYTFLSVYREIVSDTLPFDLHRKEYLSISKISDVTQQTNEALLVCEYVYKEMSFYALDAAIPPCRPTKYSDDYPSMLDAIVGDKKKRNTGILATSFVQFIYLQDSKALKAAENTDDILKVLETIRNINCKIQEDCEPAHRQAVFMEQVNKVTREFNKGSFDLLRDRKPERKSTVNMINQAVSGDGKSYNSDEEVIDILDQESDISNTARGYSSDHSMEQDEETPSKIHKPIEMVNLIKFDSKIMPKNRATPTPTGILPRSNSNEGQIQATCITNFKNPGSCKLGDSCKYSHKPTRQQILDIKTGAEFWESKANA